MKPIKQVLYIFFSLRYDLHLMQTYCFLGFLRGNFLAEGVSLLPDFMHSLHYAVNNMRIRYNITQRSKFIMAVQEERYEKNAAQ